LHSCRLFEHTADIGVEVTADSLSAVFEGAACAMVSLAVDPAGVRAVDERSIALEADDLGELMFLWLNELLFLMESERMLFSDFDVRVEGSRLEAVLRGEPADPGRHSQRSEVKAATYHELSVGRAAGGWKARVIFDV